MHLMWLYGLKNTKNNMMWVKKKPDKMQFSDLYVTFDFFSVPDSYDVAANNQIKLFSLVRYY